MAICLSVSKKTLAEVLASINSITSSSHYGKASFMIEFRVDLMSKLGIGQMSENELVQAYSAAVFAEIPFIITCRDLEKSASGKGFTSERLGMLRKGIESGAAFVDIEYEAPIEYKDQVFNILQQFTNCEPLISYHNYTSTPTKVALEKIIDDCFEMKGSVAKLATTVTSFQDNATLFSLYEYFFQKYSVKKPTSSQHTPKIIILGMGNLGKITRVAAPKLGSLLTFVCEDGHATAPGQIDVQTFLKLQEQLS